MVRRWRCRGDTDGEGDGGVEEIQMVREMEM
jgi:hypothetical protein